MGRVLRTMIVDDERSSRRAIEIQLEDMEDVEVIGQAADGDEAVRLIRETSPDLVFLDVQMPGRDGFEVIEEIGPDDLPRIVFVTAYDTFAVRAFDVSAIDYLLKPVDDKQLRRAIERARQDVDSIDDRMRTGNVLKLMEHLDQEGRARPAPYKTRLLAKEKGEYFFIPVDEVEWIEAEGNYVRVHLGSGTHLIRTSMNDMVTALDPGRFLRVHRSAIVNLDCVKAIQPEGVSDYRVVLNSNRVVKVGRTYRDSLLGRQG